MPRLIWVFAGRTATLLVLSRGGSSSIVLYLTHTVPFLLYHFLHHDEEKTFVFRVPMKHVIGHPGNHYAFPTGNWKQWVNDWIKVACRAKKAGHFSSVWTKRSQSRSFECMVNGWTNILTSLRNASVTFGMPYCIITQIGHIVGGALGLVHFYFR